MLPGFPFPICFWVGTEKSVLNLEGAGKAVASSPNDQHRAASIPAITAMPQVMQQG